LRCVLVAAAAVASLPVAWSVSLVGRAATGHCLAAGNGTIVLTT
jgi:hypothetical protein